MESPREVGFPPTPREYKRSILPVLADAFFSPFPFPLRTLAKASLTLKGRKLLQSTGMLLEIYCLSCLFRSGLA